MKKIFSVLIFININLGAVNINEYQNVTFAITAEIFSDSTAFNRLAYLCDVFGPRLSGSKNLEKATDWIISEMKKDGIKNVKGQRVKVPVWIRGDESLKLLKPYKKNLNMLGLGGSVSTTKGGITGEVVVVNNFDELKNDSLDVKGKIVLFNAPFTSYSETVAYRYWGANAASEKGAVASLVRSIGPWSMYTPHTGVMGYADNKKIPSAAITMEDAMMFGRLSDINKKIIVKLEMDAKTIADRWSKNVVGELIGSEYPDEIIVVGGHIDSWDVGQGAHDDGGACIAAWEVIRVLKKLNLRPKRTIRCVMWTNEENGMKGNSAYKKLYYNDLDKHVLAIESDGGVFSPEGFGFTGSPNSRKIIKKIHELLKPIGANTISDDGRAADIAPLNDEGVPVLSLKVNNEKYFWYHHTEADTFDKVDFNEFNRCIAAMTIMAYVVADLDQPLPR